MPFYTSLKLRFSALCHDNHLDDSYVSVKVDPTYHEKSGTALTGRTRLEGSFLGHHGMSYSFNPFQFEGTVKELLSMDLEEAADRAVFVAALNAVCGYIHPDIRTVHCSEEGSFVCTEKLVQQLRDTGYGCPGLIGFQPSFLKALSSDYGNSNIACVDHDDIDEAVRRSADVDLLDEMHLQQLIAWSDVLVVTGATLVSGTLPHILEWAELSGKPVLFYGTSIAGAAYLMDLPRFCPEAREHTTPELLTTCSSNT